MKPGYAIGIIIAVAVIAGGAFALTKKDKTTPASTTSSTSSSTNTTTTPSTTNTTTTDTNAAQSANTISYNGSAFSPSSITVKAGTTLTIKNNSSDALQFESDPHPVHTDNTELNVDLVNPSESKTFTVTKTGTWGYHNHLNPSQKGSIIVQ